MKIFAKLTHKITLVVLVMMVSILNAMAGKPRPDIPITNYLADYDAGNVPYYVQSDTIGAYNNAVNSVTSILVENGYNGIVHGDWRLDMAASALRKVGITFSAANAVQPGDPGYTALANPPFWGTQYNAVRTENKCTLINRSVLTMKAGDKFTCPMLIRLAPLGSNSDFYRLVMGFDTEPETQQVQISCNSANSGGCNDWFIDPIPVVNSDGSTSPGKTRARLNFVTTKGKGSTTNRGDFYLTFHIHATRP